MSPEERAIQKAAKAAFKVNQQKTKAVLDSMNNKDHRIVDKKQILTGLVDGEEILADDHPVHWDYLYVAQVGDTYKVVRSDIKGDVRRLKLDLKTSKNYDVINIYNCQQATRNIF